MPSDGGGSAGPQRARGAAGGRRWAAPSALATSVFVTAVVFAVLDVPPRWTGPDRLLLDPPTTGPLDAMWLYVAAWLPVGELAQRVEALAVLVVLGIAAAASWVAHQLFRGSGRWIASVVAGPLAAVPIQHWLRDQGDASMLPALAATLAATLAVGSLLRALVHFGHVGAVHRTRALAGAAFTALLYPRVGIPLGVLVAAVCLLRRKSRSLRGAAVMHTELRAWGRSLAIGVLPVAIAAVALTVVGARWPWDVRTIHLAVPPFDAIEEHVPAVALYPALALLGLLVVPLRWRGGLSLLALAGAALVVHDVDGPLAPLPILLTFVGIAAAGWVWLAGTMPSGRAPRRATISASAAAIVTVWLGLRPTVGSMLTDEGPLARRRPTASLLRLYEKGLIAPGDALLVQSPWLVRALEDQRAYTGWRPDVILEDIADAPSSSVATATAIWASEGRRVLSDSFDAGGRWDPRWVFDSGPLFWFVGDGLEIEREFTDVQMFSPDRPPTDADERERWTRLHLERARFRRAIGEPSEALAALPMSDERLQSLQTRLRLAASLRPHAGEDSEMPPHTPSRRRLDDAAILAEAGDLLYAYGERERATELLIEAASRGDGAALGALARWQIRAGEVVAARETLEALATAPELRAEALATLRWLLHRGRLHDALLVRDALSLATTDAAEEIATRLLVLRNLATDPPALDETTPPRTTHR